MHHIGTLTQTTKARPFRAQCSCGTAGDFASKEEATGYLHGHFANQTGGIATTELVDKSDHVEEEKPVPLTHAPTPLAVEEEPALVVTEPEFSEPVTTTESTEAAEAGDEATWRKKKKK